MNIGLFTSVYFNNIGNGFIDLGAEETIKRAMPQDAQLIKVSQCANFAASMGKTFLLKEKPVVNWLWVNMMQKFASRIHDKSYKTISTLDVESVPRLMKFDYMIIPGCVLTIPFFTIYGKLLQDKVNEGCKLIFLGASGNFYTDYEINLVSKYLCELNPLVIMTRDSVAYDKYKKFSQYSYNGIDNVFFVNLLNLPKLKTTVSRYSIVNIEEPKHKKIKEQIVHQLKNEHKNIIYTNHKPFPYSKVSKLVKEGVMVSDYPLDYLLLYKNADEVFSDRIHACIPNLSFGNKARLFSDSPRKELFRNMEIEFDNNGLMIVKNLSEVQNRQIVFLESILKDSRGVYKKDMLNI